MERWSKRPERDAGMSMVRHTPWFEHWSTCDRLVHTSTWRVVVWLTTCGVWTRLAGGANTPRGRVRSVCAILRSIGEWIERFVGVTDRRSMPTGGPHRLDIK